MDDPITPHLKLVHAYPHCFQQIGIDRGAIRFVLSGAALMVPGLTSAGGRLPAAEEALNEGQTAVVMAEGKTEACMVGQLNIGTEQMKADKKGVAIDAGHCLGDGLWKLDID